jgi:hypothetical protein
MNETEQGRINERCALISTEKNPAKLSALNERINDILATTGRRARVADVVGIDPSCVSRVSGGAK